MIALLATILGIGLILFVHEAGHFLAARAAGVEVEVFSLGFGPRLFGFRRGGCDYRISALPLGGYVRMKGEEERPGEGARSGGLQAASPAWRLLIYSGGILMNFLFAFLLIPLCFTFGLPFEAPVAGRVPAGTPAWEAGMRAGDRVLEVGGREVHGFRNFATAVALAEAGEPLPVSVERGGVTEELTLQPEYDRGRGFQRVGLAPAAEVLVTSGGAAGAAEIPEGTVLTAVDGIALDHPLAQEIALARALEHAGPMVFEGVVPGEDTARSWTVELVPRVPEGAPPQLGVSLLQDTVVTARGALDGHLRAGDRVLSVDDRAMEGLATLADAVLDGGGLPALRVLRDGAETLLPPLPGLDIAALADGLELGAGEVERVAVRADSAAALAGLRTGDAMLRVGGKAVHGFEELRDAVVAHVEAGSGALELTVLADGADGPRTVQATPAPIPVNDLGLALSPLQDIVRSEGFLDAVGMGVTEARQMVLEVMLTLKRMVSGEIDHRNLGGIISIGQVTHNFATQGLLPLLFFLCMVSVNLGVLNLLPIPALDGGHILFVLIEMLRGKPVSAGVQNAFNLVGVVLVLLLIVFVTTLDVNRLLQ